MFKTKKHIELILILVISAGILNMLVDTGIMVHNTDLIYDKLMYLSIGYVSVSKLLMLRNRHRTAMHMGNLVFAGACIMLYYSKTLVDYISFIISCYALIMTILLTKNELVDIKTVEKINESRIF